MGNFTRCPIVHKTAGIGEEGEIEGRRLRGATIVDITYNFSLNPWGIIVISMSTQTTPARRFALNKTTVLDVISFIARFYMAYIWIKAGVAKLGHNMDTAQSIKGYDIFTDAWANGLAPLVAPLEIAGGVLLLLGIFLRHSAIIGTIVLTLFIIGIAQAWSRGIVTDCGCLGAEGLSDEVGMNYSKTIARDVFYIVLMMWTYFRPFKKFSLYA